jgi:hypothetical protein
MDVNLLKRYDLAQDVNALYREILRNAANHNWHYQTPTGLWHSFDHLEIQNVIEDYMRCKTNDDEWILKKWIKLT